ncbi:MAG TPA: hypothetical protein VFZ65_18265 [Planctomycetota bacterium]|nr:hypothetical protein [Planctomycetota bacterium]
MIRCTPRGLFSWTFDLEGEGHRATTECNFFGEQGTIVADGVSFTVTKHGLGSGHWTLERGREVVVDAQKTSPLTRTFELRSPMGALVLRAESAFCRTFLLERGGALAATIRPEHMFTRRSTIETRAEDLDWPTLCVSFWLAALTWRRAARRD